MNYFLNRPIISLGLGIVGIGLMVASLALTPVRLKNALTTAAPPPASCSSSTADNPGGNNHYTQTWTVKEWLGLYTGEQSFLAPSGNGAVLGPSKWQVDGKVQRQAGLSCYSEVWSATKFQVLSKRIDERLANPQVYPDKTGDILNRSDIFTFDPFRILNNTSLDFCSHFGENSFHQTVSVPLPHGICFIERKFSGNGTTDDAFLTTISNGQKIPRGDTNGTSGLYGFHRATTHTEPGVNNDTVYYETQGTIVPVEWKIEGTIAE